MNNERDKFLKNCILEYKVGSHLYGTNTPTSDEDFSGVFIAPIEYYLGLGHVEECDFSHVSKLENGKNAPDAVDFKLYELRKFVKLAMENNPNILEQLWVPTDKVTFSTVMGEELLKNRHLFPHKGAKQKFLGYAYSQRHKMRVKPDNLEALLAFSDYVGNLLEVSPEMKHQFLAVFQTSNDFQKLAKFNRDNCKVGDLTFHLSKKLAPTLKCVNARIEKAGSRQELWLKHGYDTKFASHLIRLMLEGQELLLTGEIQFPLKYAETILDIKKGLWTMEDVITYSEELEKDIQNIDKESSLPAKPRYAEIENLLVTMVREYHGL